MMLLGSTLLFGGLIAMMAGMYADASMRFVMGSLIIGIFGGCLVSAADQQLLDEQHVAFTKACVADRKPYECEAMWMTAQARATPAYVPIPVVIPRIGR